MKTVKKERLHRPISNCAAVIEALERSSAYCVLPQSAVMRLDWRPDAMEKVEHPETMVCTAETEGDFIAGRLDERAPRRRADPDNVHTNAQASSVIRRGREQAASQDQHGAVPVTCPVVSAALASRVCCSRY